MRRNSTGFSLVELSIVLVILGLLTGGILAGQSLIRASELRAVSTEYQRYTAAIGSFRDKYFAMPGDMANAQKFWAAGTCPGVAGTAAAGVCNGNGDGNIRYDTPGLTSNELFGAWEHLALAGLVEGSYTGNTGDAGTSSVPAAIPGTNVPRSKLPNAGWTVYSLGVMPVADPNWAEGDYATGYIFGSLATNNVTFNPVLKPEEAWNIDTKMDDGKPSLGAVRSPESLGSSSASTACSDTNPSTSSPVSGASYALSLSGTNCSLYFKTNF